MLFCGQKFGYFRNISTAAVGDGSDVTFINIHGISKDQRRKDDNIGDFFHGFFGNFGLLASGYRDQ